MAKLDSGKRLTAHQKKILNKLIEHRGSGDVSRDELIKFSVELTGKKFTYTWIRKWGYENRVGRGKYSLTALSEIALKEDVVQTGEKLRGAL